ncbi:MAG TPA: hypothetical protein PK307_03410 [Spirochaetota bacterium]|nr:hypothetical protein [Spirochaetota bacterium]HOD15668.1 hypothetical protein [Spirochaetota bacterium]HPG51491.1 hypothetical protein [Spirochaetota bacterium]HPN14370.1 hypothetical protein [Spirochaetota bacterium]HQL81220.1 hypothetical protein [Spirochaetota bacterium]
MKRTKWAIILLILAVTMTTTCKKDGDELAVKIDDEKISINQFNNYYYMFAKMMLNMDKKDVDKAAANPEIENHPTLNILNKRKFMEFLVSRKLLYIKAFQDDSINREDLKTIEELSKIQFVSSYYLLQKLKDDIQVTDQEMNEFWNRNKDQLKGMPMNEEMEGRIRQQIFSEKLELKSNAFIIDLLGEIKVNKEGFKKYMEKIEKEKKSGETKSPAAAEPKK